MGVIHHNSGVIAVAGAGGGSPEIGGPWVLTISSDVNRIGYDFATFGDLIPSIAQITAGNFLILCESNNGADIVIEVTGIHTQTGLFTSFTVEGAGEPGTPRTFLANDMEGGNFSTPASNSFWSWGDGSNREWEFTDIGETKDISVII